MKKFAYLKHFRKLRKLAIIIVLSMTLFLVLLTVKLFLLNNKDCINPMFTQSELEIVMIDVSNSDSFLLLQNNQAMLVDSGYFTTYQRVKKVLEEYNVKKLNYVILTHPHRDHEGGFLRLMFDYRIDNLLIQHDLGNFKMSFTESLFYTISDSMIKYENFFTHNIIEVPDHLSFAKSTLEFYDTTPDDMNYNELNNYTLVFKMKYENVSMLFTGDLQKDGENTLLNSNIDLSADILKVGHHGSKTSTSLPFLKAVLPKYAMVSCNNLKKQSYGHPMKSVVELFHSQEIPLYRTDELNNVKMTTDGTNIEFDKNSGDYLSGRDLLQEQNSKH